MSYKDLSKEELKKELESLNKDYQEIKGKNISLDMSRGKPGLDQLNISMDIMNVLTKDSDLKAEATALQSYSTIVCVLYRGKLYRTWSGYSRTTANHINRFCDMNELHRISKKEWENMPVFDTAIEPLNTEFERNYNNPYMCDYFTSFKIVYPKKVV